MLKRFTAAAIVALTPSFATANQPYCATKEKLEQTFAGIDISREFEGLSYDGTLTVIFRNQETHAWSMFSQNVDGVYCAIVYGEDGQRPNVNVHLGSNDKAVDLRLAFQGTFPRGLITIYEDLKTSEWMLYRMLEPTFIPEKVDWGMGADSVPEILTSKYGPT